MYRFLKISTACIISLLIFGCQEKYERTVPPVDITGELIQTVPVEGGTYFYSVTYAGQLTAKSSADDWCKVEYLPDNAAGNIKITVAANADRRRQALVTINTFSNPTITISMNQDGIPVVIIKPKIVGNWQFKDPDNWGKATVGENLTMNGSRFFAVENLDGVEVQSSSNFLAKHGIPANGGGTKVNQYSIMFDFRLPTAKQRACFMQTTLANTDDVDIFLRNNMTQLGIGNVYTNLADPIQGQRWYRFVISARLGESLKYYLDGVEILSNDGTGDAGLDSRLALDPAGVLLLADEDGEDDPIQIRQITIWDQPLQADDVAQLGAAGSNAYIEFPGPLVGKWLFDDPRVGDNKEFLTLAETGNALVMNGNAFFEADGPTAENKAVSIGAGSNLLATHGIAASGETPAGDPAAKVNEYSILWDFKLPAATRASFMQTTLANTDDTDFFLRANMIQLGIGNVYCDLTANPIQGNVWYRLIVSAKLGESLKYYLNGVEIFTHDGTGDAALDSRLSLDPAGVLLLADEDGEDAEIHIAALAMWNKALTAEQAAALGNVGNPIE